MSRFELGPVFFFVPDRFDFVDSLFFETISSDPGTGKYAPEAKYILSWFSNSSSMIGPFPTNELTSFKFEFENHPLFLIQVIYQIWIDAKKCCSKLPFDKFQVNICRFIHYFVLESSIFPFYFQFYFRLLENISNKSRTSDQIRTSGQVYPSTSVRVHVQYICPGCSFSKMDYAKLKIHSKNPKSQLKILKISKIF